MNDDHISGPSDLADLVVYNDGSVVSRTLEKSQAGTLTVFAFDAGQAISEHTTPHEAYAHVVDGEIEFQVGGKALIATAGQILNLPADVPHALKAIQRSKMLLIMFKTG